MDPVGWTDRLFSSLPSGLITVKVRPHCTVPMASRLGFIGFHTAGAVR